VTSSAGASQRREPATIRAAWRRYAVLVAGLGVIVLAAAALIWPWWHLMLVEHVVLPRYEGTFRFRGGRLALGETSDNRTVYGLVSVVPGGRLARAGARPGDIPVEYHGGVWAFWGALYEASAGRQGHFDVVSRSDWHDWDKRRRLVVEPE
jgi:hypothetical protein